MALQVNVGTVQVTFNSTTVRHEWKLLMATSSGFVVGNGVTWPSGGAGTVGGWDSVGKVLHVARTAGPNPAAGTVITQTSPAASATVSSLATGSPPGWDVKVTLPAVATFQRHYGDYQVASVAADSFVLQTAYQGASARLVEYGLNTDFTSLGLGLIRPGDVGATNIITRSMVRLNTLLTRAFATLRLSSNVSLTSGTEITVSWTVKEEDDGGFAVGAGPWQQLVIPSGIKRVMVGANIGLTTALNQSNHVVTVSLLKGASVICKQSINQPSIAISLSRMVSVVAGDQLSVKVLFTGSGGTTPSISSATETNFSVGVLEVI